MSRIFISHSSANNAAALAVAHWLRDNGWDDYFLDVAPTRGLTPGERWQEALKAAAHRCEAVLFLISPAWRDSRWCLAEFLLAKNLSKVIFGVLVEPTPMTTLLPEMTAEWQVCDLAAGDDRVNFQVRQDPIVPATQVSFARAGLERLKAGLQKAGLDASTFLWPPPNQPDRPPYPGLRPLDVEDAAVFFGRDAAIVRGLDEVHGLQERGVERMLVILGASGAGKSSFLRAGLWPRLQRDDRHFLPLPVIRPERAAITGTMGLAASLEAVFRKHRRPNTRSRTRADIQVALRQEGLDPVLQELQVLARPALEADALPPTVIIAIDQGEELFSAEDRGEAEVLLDLLAQALAPVEAGNAEAIACRRRSLAVVVMRSDSYERLQTYERLARVDRRLFDLPPVASTNYKSIIERPAERATSGGLSLTIEPQLTDQLLVDTEGADALPLLAFTLERLFVQCGADGDLTLDEYRTLGAVRGSLEAAIAAAFAEPGRTPAIPQDTAERERRLQQGFIPWLARVDPDTEQRKRRPALWDEIPEEARPLLERLVEARLLTRDRRRVAETGQDAAVVEIAHEALLRQWPRLVSWLDQDAGRLKAADAVRRAAREWSQKAERPEWVVHRGERLLEAEVLGDRVDFAKLLGEEGRMYLKACRAREEAERKQEEEARQRELLAAQEQADAERRARLAEGTQLRWTRAFAIIASVLLAVAAWGFVSARRAWTQTRQRLAYTEFLQAVRLAESNPPEALARLARAMRLEPARSAPRSLTASVLPFVRPPVALLEHQESVYAASFSLDGTRIVTASGDKTARVWDARTGEPLAKRLLHKEAVTGASFSPDGTRILTVSWDKTARVWDARTGEPLGKPLHSALGAHASFSPDGSSVLTIGDQTLQLWNAWSGEPIAKIRQQRGVSAASFSPDGTRIVTVSSDGAACVWDTRTGEPRTKLQAASFSGEGIIVQAASYSPDGTRIVTMSGDNTARVWDARTGEPLAKALHRERVSGASFSRDGTRIVTASFDGTARVWDARSGEPLAKPLQHQNTVRAASFSPDGARIVTASEDNTARVWDARTGEPLLAPLQHRETVTAASFSPDGTRIVTTSFDGTARVWDVRTRQPSATILHHQGLGQHDVVGRGQFSPDGTRIVTTSGDGAARIWDARTGERLAEMLQHQGQCGTASFSPDGTRVVTASGGETARVWDAWTGRPLAKPLQHQKDVCVASFSPDGTRIVTAAGDKGDKTARVWDARTGDPVAKPLQHRGGVYAASFSADGTRIVTASQDRTARVWDARTGEPLGNPLLHREAVVAASFSPDGTRILTASQDRTARIWDARTQEPLGKSLQHQVYLRGASFNRDGTRVLTWGYQKAWVWDARDRELIAKIQHQGGIWEASFSADGARIITASVDKTARVWDAITGESLAMPLPHQDAVVAASFSPNGTRIVTGSAHTAQVWDAPAYTPGEAEQLADLAEAVAGLTSGDLGAVVPLPDQMSRLAGLHAASAKAPQGESTVLSFTRWLFSDPWTRTISPLSAVTVPQYICGAIRRGTVEEAQRAFPGHPLLRESPTPSALPAGCKEMAQ